MHALLQGFTPLLQPLFALQLLFSAGTPTHELRLADCTEIAIRLQIVLQIATDQLDHDGVIEEVHARIHRGRCTEAGQRVEHTLPILGTEWPAGIRGHFQHGAQPQEAFLDEASQLRALGAFQHFASGGDDVVGAATANTGLGLLRHFFQMAQIFITQMEADA